MFRWNFKSAISLLLLLCISASLYGGISAITVPSEKSKKTVETLTNSRDIDGIEVGMTVPEILVHRVTEHPFHLIATIIFFLAIIHTFFAFKFTEWAHLLAKNYEEKLQKLEAEGHTPYTHPILLKRVSAKSEMLTFLGEIEVVFALWAMILMMSITLFFGREAAIVYVSTRNLTEPLFVVVIMLIASTSPVIQFAEFCLRFFAKFGGKSPGAWWLSILTVGPILGSFITEPAAMTISALLLSKQFYEFKPSSKLAYATLGLLFVNISVGGVLTHFAAPVILMVAGPWDWDTPFMFYNFGWKAVLGILLSNAFYYFYFRSEFQAMAALKTAYKETPKVVRAPRLITPTWIIAVHLIVMGWVVLHSHYPVIFAGCGLLLLGFIHATAPYQTELHLKGPILVGLFLAGLVTHADLQGWWIEPVLESLSETSLMVAAMGLTAFNDNAAVTYLTTLIPDFPDAMKYAVVAGAISGGGLTVIANAPNPAGQSILSVYFSGGVSSVRLMLGAAIPTIIMGLMFKFL